MKISGIEIPENRTIKYSLMCIKGIGLRSVGEICKNLNIPDNLKIKDLTGTQILGIESCISKYIVVENKSSRTSTIISGVNIPEKKMIKYALTYVKGIGLTRAGEICKNLNIPYNLKTNELSDVQVESINTHISECFVLGDELTRMNATNIKKKIALGCFAGRRIVMGLPRAGSGRSNGKTVKRMFTNRTSGRDSKSQRSK